MLSAAVLAAVAAWLLWKPVIGPGRSERSVVAVALLLAVPVSVVVLPRSWVALALVGGGVGAGVLFLQRRRGERRRAEASAEQVQRFCEELSAELAAGLPVGSALDGVAARWPELAPVAAAARLGGSVPDTMRDLARRPGAGDLRLVAAAWHVAQRSGAGLAVALQSVAGSLAERQRTRRLVASELASARATARLMAVLPVLTLAMGSGAGGDPVAFLLSTTPGLACLATGCLLALAGLWWIEAIAAGIESDS